MTLYFVAGAKLAGSRAFRDTRERQQQLAGGRNREQVLLLLAGGDKSSQSRDITRAIWLAKTYGE